MKKRTHICFLLIAVLLLTAVLSGCKEKEESAKGKAREIGAKPTSEVTGTPEPTIDPTAVPTADPTPVPTGVPSAKVPKSFFGTWYAHSIEGVESDRTDCKDNPEQDYRIRIHEDSLEYIWTSDRMTDALGVRSGRNESFVLRTDFSESDREFYRAMGYGMESYLDNPTDPGQRHFVFSGTDEQHYGALFIIDVSSDGSLDTLYAYVDDNGSFPVFVEAEYKREPVFPLGTYYEDYLGIWYCRSYAPYYQDAYMASDEDPIDFRIWIRDDGTLNIIDTWGEEREQHDIYHYTLTPYFTSEEISGYRLWDQDGIEVWGERQEGFAAELAEQGTDITAGRLMFLCTDDGYEGEFLSISIRSFETGDFLCVDWIEHTSDRLEYATYLTFTRENPYSYEKGSIYSDFIGTWRPVMINRAGQEISESCADPDSHPMLFIDRNGDAYEDGNGQTLNLVSRTSCWASDPEWLADYGMQDTCTDFNLGRLVLISQNCSEQNGTIIVLEYQRDGSILAKRCDVKDGNSTFYPQILYEIETGIKR